MEYIKYIIAIAVILAAIFLIKRLFSNWKVKRIGKAGEKEMLKLLKSCRKRGDYAAGNLYIPVGDSITELDGLFINKRGVFVFEAKAYRGTVYGSDSQHDWSKTMQTNKGSEKNTFYNPIMQNSGHVRAVKSAVKSLNAPVYNVVAFADSADISNVHTNAAGTFVINFREIPSLLATTGSPILSRKEVKELGKEFKAFKKVKKSVLRKHIKEVKSKER